jgi:hypothetical protein
MRRRGVGRGVGARAAVGRRDVADSFPHGRCACRRRATGAKIGEAGDCQDFKLLHTLNGRWDLNSKKKK